MRTKSRVAAALPVLALFAALLAAYSNHFQNAFHFDDFHTIVNNAHIRTLRNIPHFFADGTTFSVLPANQTYRPVVTALMAVGYSLGGLNPFSYHVLIFLLFLLLVAQLCFLFLIIFNRTSHDRRNHYAALFGAALFALHPVCAETVNYIIQSADLLSTLAVVTGLLLYARFPAARSMHLYLLPVAFGALAKPTALIFPAILLAYNLLVEQAGGWKREWSRALRVAAPAGVFVIALAALLQWKQPPALQRGSSSDVHYWLSQPRSALHYFEAFFAPVRLTVDTDVRPLTTFDDAAFAGFIFIAGVCAAVWYCGRRQALAPTAFGLCWFLLALIPTALTPLAEVENDHRMFFPFIGLAMAFAWLAWRFLAVERPRAGAVAAVAVLAACFWGTWHRNEVWRTDESLWSDAAAKSPRNGRALMNYGLTQMGKGDYNTALSLFRRAQVFNPNYSFLELNLGIVQGALFNDAEAERHFRRAIELSPNLAEPYHYYGRWLWQRQRTGEAVVNNELALARSPFFQPALELRPALTQAAAAYAASPEAYLNLSLERHRQGKYLESIAAARGALKLRPGYAEAWNNIAAAYEALGQWDDAIEAAEKALELKPDFTLARNNLLWAESQKRQQESRLRTSQKRQGVRPGT